jgi:hypothetical protein
MSESFHTAISLLLSLPPSHALGVSGSSLFFPGNFQVFIVIIILGLGFLFLRSLFASLEVVGGLEAFSFLVVGSNIP